MGAARSKIARSLANTVRNETRMHKEISKEKPSQAPRHPSTEKAFEKMIQENPMLQKVDKLEDAAYLKMLKDVKVDSTDPEVESRHKQAAYGEDLPARNDNRKRIVPGRLTSSQILELFAKRQSVPDEWTVEKIAEKYHIDKQIAESMVKHYSSFNIIMEGKPPGPLDKIDLI